MWVGRKKVVGTLSQCELGLTAREEGEGCPVGQVIEFQGSRSPLERRSFGRDYGGFGTTVRIREFESQ